MTYPAPAPVSAPPKPVPKATPRPPAPSASSSSDMCTKCNQRLKGEVIEAADRMYHMECFTCAKCNSKLGAKFMNIDSSCYCEKCGKSAFVSSRVAHAKGTPSPLPSSSSSSPSSTNTSQPIMPKTTPSKRDPAPTTSVSYAPTRPEVPRSTPTSTSSSKPVTVVVVSKPAAAPTKHAYSLSAPRISPPRQQQDSDQPPKVPFRPHSVRYSTTPAIPSSSSSSSSYSTTSSSSEQPTRAFKSESAPTFHSSATPSSSSSYRAPASEGTRPAPPGAAPTTIHTETGLAGFLLKQQPTGFFKLWQNRYFVLRYDDDDSLVCFIIIAVIS
eukprot:TRINITY_DN4070_c1_g1_i1.p1 TRINITY_DN4070_c1_g1~~TRINITY_DN4070_c1_g1_i1.p1  ORF type:complete len:327 (+),score=99.41 TRINITY_DN4070_c1_g1_i1:95-1075(+)